MQQNLQCICKKGNRFSCEAENCFVREQIAAPHACDQAASGEIKHVELHSILLTTHKKTSYSLYHLVSVQAKTALVTLYFRGTVACLDAKINSLLALKSTRKSNKDFIYLLIYGK